MLTALEGWSSSIPAPDYPIMVNEGWRQFSFDAELIIAKQTIAAVNGQSEYALLGVKRILDVSYNALPLLRSTEEYERFANPFWQTTTGTPLRFVMTGLNAAALVPAPAGTQNIIFRCIAIGADMVLPTDLPGQVSGATPAGQVTATIPTGIHEAIALKAALLFAKAYAQGEAAARVNAWQMEYEKYVQQALENGMRGAARSSFAPSVAGAAQ